jgi:GT2 family glycosyltransferase
VSAAPSVTIVFVVYNRRDELRTSLRKMLHESGYEGRLDAVVVDNASSDGSADMVREEFPQATVIQRTENIGAPAWNDGFAVARGDWVLILDDDCYLDPGDLGRATAAAAEHEADLVSFKVVSTVDPTWEFTEKYRTGLFTFWGCAWLVRTPVIQELGGYDPELFIWANELELMLRFLDRGYRHLHLPTVVAQHMKAPGDGDDWIDGRGYRINARHWGYVAAKLLSPRDAVQALIALVARCLRDGARTDRVALSGAPETVRGFVHGLRHRRPVQPDVSHFYRHNFETFASPWWLSRPIGDIVRGEEGDGDARREEYFEKRARWYPEREPATLSFGR